MMLYAYVPAFDREYIRRCDVPYEGLAVSHPLVYLLQAFRSLGLLPGPPGPLFVTLEAEEVLVALDWLEDHGQLPPKLGERIRRETKVRRWLLYRSGKLPRELLVHKLGGWSWRECFRPYLAAVLRQLDGQEKKHQDQALREAFPAGQRKHYPYKTWLDEIRVQRGLKAPPRRPDRVPRVRMDHPKQALLFGGVS